MVTVVVRPAAADELVRRPEMLRGLRMVGEAIQGEAERIAPREASLPTSRQRHYADMFDTQAGFDSRGALATVNNRHFIALFVEFGTIHSPPRAVLRRALDGSRGRLG